MSSLPIELEPHAVHFYESTAELSAMVGDYLAEAITGGSAAVVIARAEHKRAFVAELESRGVEPEGNLLTVDAEETLSSFMPDGELDPAEFRRVIGGLITAVGDRPVVAYGEMVALLWEAGDVLAAIELEKLWNELGRERQFSLLCAYHSESVSGTEHAAAVSEVCALHTAVSGTHTPCGEFQRFDPHPDAPVAARRFVAGVLRAKGRHGSVLEDAQLVASELVTNAVVHAGTPLTVSVCTEGRGVRVSVRDDSVLAELQPLEPPPTALSGRGLMLVNLVAADWGTDQDREGKTVWAELRP